MPDPANAYGVRRFPPRKVPLVALVGSFLLRVSLGVGRTEAEAPSDLPSGS